MTDKGEKYLISCKENYDLYCQMIRDEFPQFAPATYELWVAFNEVMGRG